MYLTERERAMNNKRFIAKQDWCMWDEKWVWRIWDDSTKEFVNSDQSFNTFESADNYAETFNQ